jgi:phosphatidylglycerol:prolipoprotein diacylglycerol transferase
LRRELFRIPGLDWPIYGYGTMVLVGFLLGYLLVIRGARREGIPPEKIQDLPIWMVLSGLLGARLFYFIQFYSEEFSSGRWTRLFRIWEGGLVFYGGLILGASAFLLYCRRHRLPVLPMLDVMAPATALGLGFGRIGCFLNGCCWGKVCDAAHPLAVRFPEGSPPALASPPSPEGLSSWLHPTQLYSSANAFLLALLLWVIWRRRPAPGTVAGLLFLLYGLSRYSLERLRGDHAVGEGLSTVSQLISSGGILLGVGLIVLARWGRGANQSLQSSENGPL